jgi:group I intron endonuclease
MADKTNTGIYEIVNLVNGKRYIGSAVNFAGRWSEHRRQLKTKTHHSRYLQRSWDRYGPDAFDFLVIEFCDPADLIAREQFAIDAFRPEFNTCRIAGSTLGIKYTPEAKARVSAALKGKRSGIKRDPSSVGKMAASHRGRKRSEETRKRISTAKVGSKMPPRSEEHRLKLSAAQKGRKKSPEHLAAFQAGRASRVYSAEDKAKISAALKTQYESGVRSRERPPEYREKIAAALKGVPHSPERRAKQAAAQVGLKHKPYAPMAPRSPERSAEIGAAISARQIGKKRSAETKLMWATKRAEIRRRGSPQDPPDTGQLLLI